MFLFLRLAISTHVYFAQNAAYFPFNSWLSFQRLCRLYGDVGYEYCSSGAPRSVIEYGLPFMCIIVKKLNSLKHLVRSTVAESHN